MGPSLVLKKGSQRLIDTVYFVENTNSGRRLVVKNVVFRMMDLFCFTEIISHSSKTKNVLLNISHLAKSTIPGISLVIFGCTCYHKYNKALIIWHAQVLGGARLTTVPAN